MNCPVCKISCISAMALALHTEAEHPAEAPAPCDVSTSGWGQTLVVFELKTPAAHEWTDQYVEADPYQWMGPNRLCIEHRYAPQIANAMLEGGLEVSGVPEGL